MQKIKVTQDLENDIKEAMVADIPHIYSNGFNIVLGTGDVNVVLKRVGETVATLNLSYTLAKTLSEKLGGLIKFLENKTGNTIMTTDDLEKFLTQENSNDTKNK